ncbi:hypothetical protein [Pelotalea chapellei]|uniref:Uncharacterized protein n=1 Tax=Pelotalea chapellei TaxID=44671 RepID=A0ABS5U6M9_9BACT|nr:hypothetical protein [Pelotalea chapellei]MBT1071303.1 hypothetical protein [Pelotalea chapellei]
MDAEVRTQREQVVSIIRMLQAMLVEIREAFVRQQVHLLNKVGSERKDIAEETAFTAAEADELMVGRLWRDREPIIEYQDILRHLKLLAGDLEGIAEVLRRQIGDRIPFSDKMMEQVNLLLGRQEMLLHSIAGMVSTGETTRSREISRICSWLGQHCLLFATQHESRLVEGLLSASAPLFLSILDRMQTLVHHELELIRLLEAWIESKTSGRSMVNYS